MNKIDIRMWDTETKRHTPFLEFGGMQSNNLMLTSVNNRVYDYALGKMILEFWIGLCDINDNKIYQADILKITYMDKSSHVFERMKEHGDTEIFIILDVPSDYHTTTLRTHDEDKYFTGESQWGDSLMFLAYLIKSGAVEIVGNIHTHKIENDKLVAL